MKTATSLNVLFDGEFKVSAVEQLKRTCKAGFKYIDMNFWDWGHSPNSPFMQDNWIDWVKGIKECGDELGVKFHQAHAMVYNPFDTSTPKLEMQIEATERSVIGAGVLGIDWVVFHAVDHAELSLQKNVEWLTPYVELALKHNTGIAIENMNDNGKNLRFSTSAKEIADLVDALGSPNVGNCWDIGHAHCQKVDQYAEIMTLGDRLKVLHVQDNNGLQDQHTAPYYGTIDWKVIKKALVDVNYQGEFTFEAHTLIRAVPDDCKDTALKLLFDIGENICNM
jgi:Sugar phosphate isomerases/epimerases